MRRWINLYSHDRASNLVVAASAAFLAVRSNNDRREMEQSGGRESKPCAWQQQCQTWRGSYQKGGDDIQKNRNYACTTNLLLNTASCDAVMEVTNEGGNYKQELYRHGMDYYYMRMKPDDMFEASTLESHAIFGPLLGKSLIERFNVYKRINTADSTLSRNEIALVDLKLGNKLNGHNQIVHGGIISLLFDTALGFGYHVCLCEDKESIAVTANLNINFRAPFRAGSEGVVRIYLDRMEGRKIFFSAVLESQDGSIVYAEATSLFLKIDRSKVVKNN